MKIGLIGTGRIGAFHAATLHALEGVTDLVVADADATRAASLAASLGVRAAPGIAEMYAEGLDGVVITAATSAHATLIHQALDAGVPVFCEKPVALDVPGTIGVVERAAAGSVPVPVSYTRCTPCAPAPATGRRRRQAISPPPAGCSGTAASMTSTSCAG